VRQTNSSLSLSLNFNLEGFPPDLLHGLEVRHLRVLTVNTYSFQQLSPEFVEVSASICLVNGKWLMPSSDRLRNLSCEGADVRLNENPNIKSICSFEAHISCKTALVGLRELSVTSTSIRASDFEGRLKSFFNKSNAHLQVLQIKF
jgi:hypothetical protein